MDQPNRLSGALPPPEFSNPLIDRSKPIRFKLDALTVDGFAGDSVLSALLAAGVDRAGTSRGHPVALDRYSAPNVTLAGNEGRSDLVMPMAMCPAVDGVQFATIAPKSSIAPVARLARSISRRPRSLEIDLGTAVAATAPWIDLAPASTEQADIVVVGAGVAGLSAALEAAKRSTSVILIEREMRVGGLSLYFGKAEGEPLPADLLASLEAEARAHPRITVMTGTNVFALEGTRVRALAVGVENAMPRPKRVDVVAGSVILATGCEERLPIFPGNRLPGVALAAESWRLARDHNVWPGKSAHIHTSTNAGYRMALLGSDSGREIKRVSDPRYNPQTRFIEFCKAFGFRFAWGAAISDVQSADAQGRYLAISHRDTDSGRTGDTGISAERLIVSGGWQPDTTLWMLAGGAVRWHAPTGQIEPAGALGGVDIAGSAAGYQSLAGCAQSGVASAQRSLGTMPEPVVEHLIDEIFETRDGALTLSSPSARGLAPAFLSPDGGAVVPEPPIKGWRSLFLRDTATGRAPARAQTQLDVVGQVVAGLLEPSHVTAYCAQRCILPTTLVPQSPPRSDRPSADEEQLPAYLAGRYGSHRKLWTLDPSAGRRFEAGNFVFANTDDTSPLLSIGVIVATGGHESRALIGNVGLATGDVVYVRDGLNCTEVRLKGQTEQTAGESIAGRPPENRENATE